VRLAQIFSNLLTNAAKFTLEDGHVIVRSRISDGTISIEVADTGAGIEPELLPQVFDPFRQAETGTTRRFGGLGLGLSVARGLVEAHGGKIGVRSGGRDQGATFTVELPLLSASDSPSPATSSPEQPAVSAKSMRILLVEDHEDTRRVLERLLTRWGHQVTVAGSVAQTRQSLDGKAFDLLLSDIGLPDGSGLDVIRAFREISSAPAIAMSGYGMEADLARTQAAGFSEHIIKPVAAERLREILARLGKAQNFS
jgi:CheY-like chemotaxis protein